MSDIQRYRPQSPASSSRSRTGREIARIAVQADLAIARSNAIADLELAKLDALQIITGRAMQGVALVSQLEQQLSSAVPLDTIRLQAIGDMHALASADVVASAPRRLS